MVEELYADELAAARRDYPVGSVVEVQRKKDAAPWRARVTGHSALVNRDGSRIEYSNPGVRVAVSTTPPDADNVENEHLDGGRAAAVPPEELTEG